MEILRFITAGSVDDGKSTFLGRLLLDADKLPHDIAGTFSSHGSDPAVNLAHVTDGLRRERAEGITIDVAYRYFATKTRKYIVIDAPGHFEYTRNMFTGASNADVMLIIVDVTRGISEQTRLHLQIAKLLRLKRVIVCINKMDAIGYSETLFGECARTIRSFAAAQSMAIAEVVPVSALQGDNVVHKSRRMPWYNGKSVFEILEGITFSHPQAASRAQVQHSASHGMERYHFCHVSGGKFRVDSEVCVYPSGERARIRKLYSAGRDVSAVSHGEPATLVLEPEIAIERGSYLVSDGHPPEVASSARAVICCFDSAGIRAGSEWLLMNGSQTVFAVVANIEGGFQEGEAGDIPFNQIGHACLEFREKIAVDRSGASFETSRFLLVDRDTGHTVAAGYFI
jgi:sulfate adenylyltransferase large subunit